MPTTPPPPPRPTRPHVARHQAATPARRWTAARRRHAPFMANAPGHGHMSVMRAGSGVMSDMTTSRRQWAYVRIIPVTNTNTIPITSRSRLKLLCVDRYGQQIRVIITRSNSLIPALYNNRQQETETSSRHRATHKHMSVASAVAASLCSTVIYSRRWSKGCLLFAGSGIQGGNRRCKRLQVFATGKKVRCAHRSVACCYEQ